MINLENIQLATPEIYLNNLRSTITQEWENGLPVIEDFLAKQEYRESVLVIQETLDSLLQHKQDKQSWTPETSLLFLLLGGYSHGNVNQENAKKLLRYYQQAVRELGETERVNALEIQCIAFECCYDWSKMLEAFAEIPVTENTRQALLNFWRDSIIKRCTPHSYLNFYTREESVSIWWLHWLLDSITSEKTGKAWFGEQAIACSPNLPGDRGELGGEYGVLRLLTKDLSDIQYQGKCPYSKFYEVVVVPSQQSTPDDTSRRKYLQEYAPSDLWGKVMDYWKVNLHNFVPKPELSQNSDYSTNAAWMSALKELSPQNYQMLLSQWKVNHQRRRNLWKAMGNLGLM